MRWRQDDLNGKYTEVANDDVEAFRSAYRSSRQDMASVPQGRL